MTDLTHEEVMAKRRRVQAEQLAEISKAAEAEEKARTAKLKKLRAQQKKSHPRKP